MHFLIDKRLALALLLTACGGKQGGDDESSSGGATDETVGHSSATTDTGEDPPPTGGQEPEPTGGSGETGTSGETGVATEAGGSGESGEAPASPPCEAMCEQALMCGLVDGLADCVAACADSLAGSPSACAAASADLLTCLGDLECGQLEDALEGGFAHPCNGLQLDKEEICDPEVDCDWGAGGDFMGANCLVEINCPDQPKLEMKCDTEVCLCLEGGREVGSCPADDVCLDIGTVQDKAPGCCGFPPVER